MIRFLIFHSALRRMTMPPVQLALGFIAVGCPSLQAAPAAEIQFHRDVRPILSDTCFHCHGPSSRRKAKLRLDTFASATDPERSGGAVIVPGKPERSPFVDRILAQDPDDIMPPPDSHKHLSKPEKKS